MDPPSAENHGAALSRDRGSVERRLKHGALAARTVAVSFRAAMGSARRHLRVSDDEREQIKHRWRSWALETLEGYERELAELVAGEPITGDGAVAALAAYREELERAFEIVRSTEGD